MSALSKQLRLPCPNGFQVPDNYSICRQPAQRVELIVCKPLGIFVLEQVDSARHDARQVAVHRQVKLGIVIFHGRHEYVRCNFYRKFFLNFTHDGLLGGFAGLDLAAGKFPTVFEFTGAALRGGVSYKPCKRVYMRV